MFKGEESLRECIEKWSRATNESARLREEDRINELVARIVLQQFMTKEILQEMTRILEDVTGLVMETILDILKPYRHE
jgi:hypothetical protein